MSKSATEVQIPPWKEFEKQIADLYRSMGYEVKEHVGILGHEIDILLTKKLPGNIEVKTAIECKYVKKGNLHKNKVIENINNMINLRRSEEVHGLVVVTTHGFARDLWDTATKNNIELLTLRELQHQIVNFEPYLTFLIKDFQTDDLCKYYVNLFAEKRLEERGKGSKEGLVKDFSPKRGEQGTREPVELMSFIMGWLEKEESNHLSLLGDYGTGKTSFCRKLAHDLAQTYQEERKGERSHTRIPLLVSLREYSKVVSIQQLITDLLVNMYGLQINFQLFEHLNANGMFVLIFDGFDEMSQKVVFDIAYTNFDQIAELAKTPNSKVLLTCRSEFFRTYEQARELLLAVDQRPNFELLSLKEFTPEQIQTFLQQRVPLLATERPWQYYEQKIRDIYDLEDLAKRPVLLELITRYLPALVEKEEQGTTITAHTLYDTVIDEEIEEAKQEGRTFIQKVDRIKLMMLLATWMTTNNELEAHYSDLPSLLKLKDHFNLQTKKDIEFHLHEFLTCSFLGRNPQGYYRFSHKSFVEYLVGKAIVSAGPDDRTKLLEEFWKLESSTQVPIIHLGSKELLQAIISDRTPLEEKHQDLTRIWLHAWAYLHVLDPQVQSPLPKVNIPFKGKFWIIHHENDKLVELELRKSNLSTIPENLFFWFKDIEILDLSGNNLSSLPESFGNLRNLKELYLHENQLSSLPETFGQLTGLQQVWLTNNQLSSLPETFGQLTRLQELWLQRNQLSSLPGSFDQLTSLKRLYIDKQLKKLPSVQALKKRGCLIS